MSVCAHASVSVCGCMPLYVWECVPIYACCMYVCIHLTIFLGRHRCDWSLWFSISWCVNGPVSLVYVCHLEPMEPLSPLPLWRGVTLSGMKDLALVPSLPWG